MALRAVTRGGLRSTLASCPRLGRSSMATTCRAAADAGDAQAAAAAPRRSLLAGAAALGLAATAVVAGAAPVALAAGGPPACPAEPTTAPNGLQFCELQEGTGKSPAAGSMIRCHYTGWLTSGKVFDSSYERGRPLSFKIGAGQVIKGWDVGILGGEGIPPMKEGGKRLLTIPANLAYGDRGAGGVIPPGSTLVFLVELLGRRKG